MTRRGRVIYVQYTNPAFYPPLEHSSQILAESRWEILFLGIGVNGIEELSFAQQRGIATRLLRACRPGVLQKLHYAWYCVWVMAWTLRYRPQWIYASDQSGALPALLAGMIGSSRVIYHEHDSPALRPRTFFDRLLAAARRRLCARSAVCVLPSRGRIPHFIETTGVHPAKVVCSWNCPRKDEARPEPIKAADAFAIYYHGSINRERLPTAIVRALALLPAHTRLRIVGYETVGSRGYVDELKSLAGELGIADRVEYLGALKTRREILDHARACHLGLAFMPKSSGDINMTHMLGASNKPFDYLACGMALLVTDLDDWRDMFATGGYGLVCDPTDAQGVAAAVRSLMKNTEAWRQMADAGRERVISTWNYESQFAPLLELMNTAAARQ
jgi:glycosyltransferase involved in cell wall biosynthesis